MAGDSEDFGSDIIRCDGGETGTRSNSDSERMWEQLSEFLEHSAIPRQMHDERFSGGDSR